MLGVEPRSPASKCYIAALPAIFPDPEHSHLTEVNEATLGQEFHSAVLVVVAIGEVVTGIWEEVETRLRWRGESMSDLSQISSALCVKHHQFPLCSNPHLQPWGFFFTLQASWPQVPFLSILCGKLLFQRLICACECTPVLHSLSLRVAPDNRIIMILIQE